MSEGIEYQLCPKFEAAFEILGKKWTALILDVLFYQGRSRFKMLNQQIPAISERVLAVRLKELENQGIVIKYFDETSGYELTEKGEALANAISDVKKWAELFC